MAQPLRKWLQISFFNLLFVALAGLIMRYKIAYSLPWVDQKNLLHAHSHFAFAGWITQALMSLLIGYLSDKGDAHAFRRYRLLLWSNLITAYGMLLTFPVTGYAFLSITFSTASIFVSYWFAIVYWRDLNKLVQNSIVHRWFKAAVVFNAISSLGAFSLAYMFATRNVHPNPYLASIYFFLHFQYNGWFFFALMGLTSYRLIQYGFSERELKKIYLLFVTACLPAYFLSALWLPTPRWVYLIVVLAVILQLIGWGLMLQLMRKTTPIIKQHVIGLPRTLFVLSAIALSIKLLLQAASVIPSLSQLAFGFRPIVIGYLHLVLLGIITIFIIAYSTGFNLIPLSTTTRRGIIVFVAAVIINEALLMIQGITNMDYQPIPFINQLLLIAAFILFAGIFIINLGQHFHSYDSAHKRSKPDE